MDIQFDITKNFEKDLAKLSSSDQRLVATSIDKYASTFDLEKGDPSGKIYQLHKIKLPQDLESSLYILRVTHKLRIIMAIDEDPLFSQKIITLFRVVGHDSLDRVHKSISESLYQQMLNSGDQT